MIGRLQPQTGQSPRWPAACQCADRFDAAQESSPTSRLSYAVALRGRLRSRFFDDRTPNASLNTGKGTASNVAARGMTGSDPQGKQPANGISCPWHPDVKVASMRSLRRALLWASVAG